MLVSTAINGMLEIRSALRDTGGVSNPAFISEQIQKLAQYTGVAEEHLAEQESALVKLEAQKFQEYIDSGKSVNMTTGLMKYAFSDERADITKLSRLANSSWKIIGVAQSRIKHLIAEANNQI